MAWNFRSSLVVSVAEADVVHLLHRDVNKDLTPKDQDKDNDLTPKDQDKDNDLSPKDQDKDLKYILKESLRTRINITAIKLMLLIFLLLQLLLLPGAET